jgi:hypothetical protein
MPNNPAYSSVDGVPVNYIPGDWPQTAAERDANELAFTDGEGQELSTAVQVTEADQADLDISGDERLWPEDIAAIAVAAPSALTPDIQGNQAKNPNPASTVVPYIGNHLYP